MKQKLKLQRWDDRGAGLYRAGIFLATLATITLWPPAPAVAEQAIPIAHGQFDPGYPFPEPFPGCALTPTGPDQLIGGYFTAAGSTLGDPTAGASAAGTTDIEPKYLPQSCRDDT